MLEPAKEGEKEPGQPLLLSDLSSSSPMTEAAYKAIRRNVNHESAVGAGNFYDSRGGMSRCLGNAIRVIRPNDGAWRIAILNYDQELDRPVMVCRDFTPAESGSTLPLRMVGREQVSEVFSRPDQFDLIRCDEEAEEELQNLVAMLKLEREKLLQECIGSAMLRQLEEN